MGVCKQLRIPPERVQGNSAKPHQKIATRYGKRLHQYVSVLGIQLLDYSPT